MTNNTSQNNIMNEAAIKEKYLRGNTTKLQMAKTVTIIMMIAALLLPWSVIKTPVNQPHKTNKWVYDADKILSDTTIDAINEKSGALFNATGSGIVVVIEKGETNQTTLDKKADKLFKDYKVNDYSVLLLIAVPYSTSSSHANSRNFFEDFGNSIGEFFEDLFGNGKASYAYKIGRNIDWSFDSKTDGIFAGNFDKSYSAGNYNAAVLDTFNAFVGHFQDYYKIDDIAMANSSNADDVENPTRSSAMVSIFGVIILFVLLAVIFGILFKKSGQRVSKVYKNPLWFGDQK